MRGDYSIPYCGAELTCAPRLTWTGSQRLTYEGELKVVKNKEIILKRSRRTQVLDWLIELPRLTSLALHGTEYRPS